MKVFHCDHCSQLVFFENSRCVRCTHPLAYLVDLGVVGSLDRVSDQEWVSPLGRAAGRRYRLCENYRRHNVCNWTVAADDPNPLCRSCRLTRMIPNLDQAGHKEAWYRLEIAKRRLVYTLLVLQLPLCSRLENPQDGLEFDFLADTPAGPKVLTGHNNGVITVNVAEADDAERERRRHAMGEPYRTLLGHFRHESGHYYWDRLIRNRPAVDDFRRLFGDERDDYAGALKRHYEQGPPTNWTESFVSAYASSHPWEDWAETWAHYLHMTDTLEMARACGVTLHPRRADEPTLPAAPSPTNPARAFDELIDAWYPLTYLLNNLNRGMGLPDGYPFVLSPRAVDKLRFLHETIRAVDTAKINH